MTSSMQMNRYLLITDSRGNDLEGRLNTECKGLDIDLSFKVLILSGRNIENMLKDAEDHLKNHTYSGIYFMGGVNNLTLKHCSKRITATFDEIPNCVDTMFTKFERARELLMKYSRKIIICFLIGLDIDKYNFETTGEQTNNHRQQLIVNDSVIYINRALLSLNMDLDMHTPWTANSVHMRSNRKYQHRYWLLRDGLHPGDALKEQWVTEIVKSTVINNSK